MRIDVSSKTVAIGTDVAAFVLFHPDDLVHRKNDPIAWYGYSFAYQRESREGRLIAFSPGSDGGYNIRLTTGGLTRAEANRACRHWEFPLVVRHGRILLDNTDALPGEEQMTVPAEDSDYWFELANDSYRVTVYPMSFNEGVTDDTAPDYVITFEPLANISFIPIASAPPTLKQLRDWVPPAPFSLDTDEPFKWPVKAPEAGEFPMLPVISELTLLPSVSAEVFVEDKIADAIFPGRDRPNAEHMDNLVVGTTFNAGDLAMLVRANGLSRRRNEPRPRLGMQGTYPVRILDSAVSQPLQSVAVAIVDKPDMSADASALLGFRDKLLTHAQANSEFRSRLRNASFEMERLEALQSAEAVTGWALRYLAMPWHDRLACYASSVSRRIAVLNHFLENGVMPASL